MKKILIAGLCLLALTACSSIRKNQQTGLTVTVESSQNIWSYGSRQKLLWSGAEATGSGYQLEISLKNINSNKVYVLYTTKLTRASGEANIEANKGMDSTGDFHLLKMAPIS